MIWNFFVFLLVQMPYDFSPVFVFLHLGNLEGKFSPHGEKGQGSLSNGSLQVLFDSTLLNPNIPQLIKANQEYTVTLQYDSTTSSNQLKQFKGFLFRLSGRNDESVDGTLYVEDDDQVQDKNSGCASTVSAMTHTNNNGKSQVEFKFQYFDEVIPLSLLLEVTVLIDKSVNNWFYDVYNLDVVG